MIVNLEIPGPVSDWLSLLTPLAALRRTSEMDTLRDLGLAGHTVGFQS